MAEKRIKMKNNKVYYVRISGNDHYITGNGLNSHTKSLPDALDLIRSHSGSEVESIT